MIIVMGVSGCGKTTIGELLANNLGLPFYDADDFHPKSNVEKMKNGTPLTDTDRQPWLEILARQIAQWEPKGGAVLSCSALKESYRQTLASGANNISWVYLSGSFELIAARMRQRKGHYMPEELLRSQFDALEIPQYAIKVDIANTPDDIIGSLTEKIKINE